MDEKLFSDLVNEYINNVLDSRDSDARKAGLWKLCQKIEQATLSRAVRAMRESLSQIEDRIDVRDILIKAYNKSIME